METVIVKGIEIGVGSPKIIVPIVGKTPAELVDEASFLQAIDFDVVEWRADHFLHVDEIDAVKSMANKITQLLPNKPLLFTFRTQKEGGVKPLPLADYVELNCIMASSGLVDLIDVEIFIGDEHVKDLITTAHKQNVFVITSNHDFVKTPSKNEIIDRLRKMQDLGADILKIAVMPQTIDDVLILLCATSEMKEKYATKPLITMSMSELGVVSRLSGETFGSAMTFGAAKNISAPGQIGVKELRYILSVLHKR